MEKHFFFKTQNLLSFQVSNEIKVNTDTIPIAHLMTSYEIISAVESHSVTLYLPLGGRNGQFLVEMIANTKDNSLWDRMRSKTFACK